MRNVFQKIDDKKIEDWNTGTGSGFCSISSSRLLSGFRAKSGACTHVHILIILFVLLTGCTVGKGSGVFPPGADLSATPPLGSNDTGQDYKILVANGLSETLTEISRTDGKWEVTPDVLSTGQAPNDMVIRDGLCYLVNSLSNSIQIFDPVLLTFIREISTGSGTNPVFIDFIDGTTAAVTCYLSNEVLFIDLSENPSSDNRIIARIAMPAGDDLPHDNGVKTSARPGGIAVVDSRCFVACANLEMAHTAGGPGLLVEIDIANISVSRIYELTGRDTLRLIHSPRFPSRLIILSAGNYDYATGFIGDGTVESFDLDSNKIFQTIHVDGAPFGGVIGSGDILFMENGKESAVLRADLHSGTSLPGFPLPTYGAALSYASSMLALPGILLVTDFNSDRMFLLDPLDGSVLAQLITGDGPDAMALVK